MATSPYAAPRSTAQSTPHASLYRRLGPHHFAYLRPIAEGLDPIDPVPAMVLARLSVYLCT